MNSSNIYYPLSGLINAFTSIILGLFVLSKNRSNIKHITYALFCLSIAVWSSFYFAWLVTDVEGVALFCSRGFMAGAIFIPCFYLHHIVTLLNLNVVKRRLIRLIYGFSFIALLANLTPDFVTGLTPRLSFKFWPIPGIIFNIFLPTWGFIAVYGAYLILKSYNNSIGVEKNRLRYVLIGTIIGWSGGATNYFLWYGISVPPFLNILVSVYIGIVAYAIVRHQLMDIEVIIKRTLVFAGLLASTFAIIVLPTLIIQEYLVGRAGFVVRLAGLTISGIFIIFAMQRIKDFLANVTDKFLFQKKYDYKELLKTFTSEVLTVLDLNKLVKTTVDKLSQIIKLDSCGILLFDENKGDYRLVASQGIKEKNIIMTPENTLVSFLSKTKTSLSTKLLEKGTKTPERIKEDMERLKFDLAIPLITIQGEMPGILTLGKKKSDEDYTQDDMDILLPLARTLAIAISNAQMFVELGETQAEAAQKDKMAVIGTLSAGINHEICNPLGIARGHCEAFLLNMKDGLYKDKTSEELIEKAQVIMGKVIHETDRATGITKRLSSFSKPSKDVVSEDVNIKHEIAEVLALVSYQMRLNKIDIVQDIGEDVPSIRADKKQIQQIFFNLIRNSAQAITERGKLTIRAKRVDGKVFVEIEDTGHGIPEDKIEQIFNPFYTTKEPGKGTGLGLFIVRQVVERNGGKISVKSKVGEGTTFLLEFPAAVKAKA
ncbi:MAG: ATP-binding protein [Omnitrophica bacterium]|nr:ATP-binding protein [Candidatus Omnitrophota bacterium]